MRQEKTLANRHILCLILRGTEADLAQQDVGSQGTAIGYLLPAETKQKRCLTMVKNKIESNKGIYVIS